MFHAVDSLGDGGAERVGILHKKFERRGRGGAGGGERGARGAYGERARRRELIRWNKEGLGEKIREASGTAKACGRRTLREKTPERY